MLSVQEFLVLNYISKFCVLQCTVNSVVLFFPWDVEKGTVFTVRVRTNGSEQTFCIMLSRLCTIDPCVPEYNACLTGDQEVMGLIPAGSSNILSYWS